MTEAPQLSPTQIGFTATTDQGPIEIWGHKVVFPGYEGFGFVVHRDLQFPPKWRVSEVTTGFALGADHPTRKAAIEMAMGLLQARTPEQLTALIAEALRLKTQWRKS